MGQVFLIPCQISCCQIYWYMHHHVSKLGKTVEFHLSILKPIFTANMPKMGFNNMLHQMHQQQQQAHMGMPAYMYNQGFNVQGFTQQNLLQLVQDMKQRVRICISCIIIKVAYQP